MKFKAGKLYRNDNGRDMDVFILRVRYQDEHVAKLFVVYKHKRQKWCGVNDKIEIKNFADWYEVKDESLL